MKFKKINFSISVPVVPLQKWHDFKYTCRKFVFRLAPFHCAECGARMNYKHISYHKTDGKLVVENSHYGPICHNCIIEQLQNLPWKPRFNSISATWKNHHCDSCHKDKESFSDVQVSKTVSLMFCVQAWNYNHVCADCVIDTIRDGNRSTSRYGLYKGRYMSYNEKRLFITPKGDLA